MCYGINSIMCEVAILNVISLSLINSTRLLWSTLFFQQNVFVLLLFWSLCFLCLLALSLSFFGFIMILFSSSHIIHALPTKSWHSFPFFTPILMFPITLHKPVLHQDITTWCLCFVFVHNSFSLLIPQVHFGVHFSCITTFTRCVPLGFVGLYFDLSHGASELIF